MSKLEYILCAAIYVDTGKAEPRRMSESYPETGLVFAGWRHGDCFVTLNAWIDKLSESEKAEIETIQVHQLLGRNQGFLTSKGRFVDRYEAMTIAVAAGQVDSPLDPDNPRMLISELLY